MSNKKYFIVIFSLFFINMIFLKNATPIGGIGAIERINNLSDYSVKFYFAGEGPSIHFELPPGTKVRLKNLKTGNYLAVAKKETQWTLVNTKVKSSDDSYTIFTVARYLDDRGQDWLGLKSDVAEGKFLNNDLKFESTKFEVDTTVGDPSASWKINEKTIKNCTLTNKESGVACGIKTEKPFIKYGDEITLKADTIGKFVELVRKKKRKKTIGIRAIGAGEKAKKTRKFKIIDPDNPNNRSPLLNESLIALKASNNRWVGSGIYGKITAYHKKILQKSRRFQIKLVEGSVIEKEQLKTGDKIGLFDFGKNRYVKIDPSNGELIAKGGKKEDPEIKKDEKFEISRIIPPPKGKSYKIGIEIIKIPKDSDQREGIPAKGSRFFGSLPIDKRPTLEGRTKEVIENFSSGSLINLQPMYNNGAAWQSKSLRTSGKATISFFAKAEDLGDIQVLFSDAIGIDYRWRIVIGGEENRKSSIFLKQGDKEIEVASVTKETYPFAMAKPGDFYPYWVSINNGHILVGQGVPGENPFLSWQDQNKTKSRNINRVGFGTNKSKVEYTEIQELKPVVTKASRIMYSKNIKRKKDKFSIPALKGETEWIDTYPLRISDHGVISFNAKSDDKIIFTLGQEDYPEGEKYYVIIDPVNNYKSSIKKDTKLSIPKKLTPKRIAGKTKYWVSILENPVSKSSVLIAGRNKPGQNPFLVFNDITPLKNIKKIGFTSFDQKTEIQNIEVGPPVVLTLEQEETKYKRKQEVFKFSGDLIVISPFKYEFYPKDQVVVAREFITKKESAVGTMPQQMGRYFFNITIEETGNIDIKWSKPPLDAEEKIEMEKKAAMGLVKSESMRSMSETLFAGAATMGMVAGEGYLGTAAGIASLGTTGAAIGTGVAAAQIAKQAKMLEIQKQFAFREHDPTGIEIETLFGRGAAVEGTIPLQARKNAVIVKNIQKAVEGNKNPETILNDFVTLLVAYEKIMRHINHFHVVEEPAVKQTMLETLRSLFNAHAKAVSRIPSYANRLMELLIKAHDNRYIIDINNENEVQRKEEWYNWITIIGRKVFAKRNLTTEGFVVAPFHGEYIWLGKDQALPTLGSGSVVFEVQGLNDAFIGLAQSPEKIRNTESQLYEFKLGANKNKEHSISIQSLGKSVKTLQRIEYPTAMLNPVDFEKFWVSYNKRDGSVSLGKNDLTPENTILKWQDPYPVSLIKYVGLSSWNSDMRYRKVLIGPPVEEVSEWKRAGKWPPKIELKEESTEYDEKAGKILEKAQVQIQKAISEGEKAAEEVEEKEYEYEEEYEEYEEYYEEEYEE